MGLAPPYGYGYDFRAMPMPVTPLPSPYSLGNLYGGPSLNGNQHGGPSPNRNQQTAPSSQRSSASISPSHRRETGSSSISPSRRQEAGPSSISPSHRRESKPLASHRPSKVAKKVSPKNNNASRATPLPQGKAKAKARTSDLSLMTQRQTPAAMTTEQMKQPISPPNLSVLAGAPEAPSAASILEPNGCLRWQIRMARHLAYTDVHGPYEIGDFLCQVNGANGKIIKVGRRNNNEEKQDHSWQNLFNGGRIPERKTAEELFGAPISGPDGSFEGFQGEKVFAIPPIYVKSADQNAPFRHNEEKSPFRPGSIDPMWF